jgi:hypothetical protein
VASDNDREPAEDEDEVFHRWFMAVRWRGGRSGRRSSIRRGLPSGCREVAAGR